MGMEEGKAGGEREGSRVADARSARLFCFVYVCRGCFWSERGAGQQQQHPAAAQCARRGEGAMHASPRGPHQSISYPLSHTHRHVPAGDARRAAAATTPWRVPACSARRPEPCCRLVLYTTHVWGRWWPAARCFVPVGPGCRSVGWRALCRRGGCSEGQSVSQSVSSGGVGSKSIASSKKGERWDGR